MNAIINEINEFIETSLRLCSSNKWKKTNVIEANVQTLCRLNGYCAMISQTVLQMLFGNALWECEILMRTISEGTIKILFMCSDTNTINDKIQQYREELSDYAIDKDSSRAVNYVEKINALDDVHRHMYRMTDNFTVSFDNTRKERKLVEQKWSYIEMLNQIEKSSFPFADKITALTCGYGLSSHFVHADYVALGIAWERADRQLDEQKLLHDAHASRIMGDMISLTRVRVWTLNKNGDGDFEEYATFEKSFNKLMKKVRLLSEPWNDYYKKNYM